MTAAHLTQLLALTGTRNAIDLMNALQTEYTGLVSDCAVWADDVPDCDAERAIKILRDGELARQGQQNLL